MFSSLRRLSAERAHTASRVGDLLLIGVATWLATWHEGPLGVLSFGLTATLLWLLASRVVRQYDAANGRGFMGDLALTLVMFLTVSAVLFGVGALLGRMEVERFATVLIPSGLALRAVVVGPRLRTPRPVETVLVLGVGPLGRVTGKEMAQGDRRLIGYLRFEDEAPHPHLHTPVLGTVADLETVLREHVVDEVYMAATAEEHGAAVQTAIRTCERFGTPFALPAFAYRLTRAKPVGELAEGDGYSHFLSVRQKPVQLWLKRLFDLTASGVALALLSPLLLGVAAAVKVTSRGPVLFRQRRVGLHGRTFDMLKFRSMVADAEAMKAKLLAQNEQSGPVFKMKRDPRVTAVGRFIRKFSIDELPQLVNVLRGDMSIVGPRPPLPNEVRRYEAWQRRRLSVRPGLTCVWQVSGRSEISFEDWMLLDMRYIDHWSLAQDFQLILRTVPVVLTGRGAS